MWIVRLALRRPYAFVVMAIAIALLGSLRTNSSPDVLEALNDIPVKQLGGSTVYLRDVAHVRDGYAVQTSMVHADGRRSAMLSILKTPVASTLDIVNRVKEVLPRIESTLPPELNVRAFNHRFERVRERYTELLALALRHRLPVAAGFGAFVIVSASLFPFLGEDFFPDVDAGQFRLHVRGAPGTRIEETEQLFAAVEDSIRRVIPAGEIDTILDDIGIPAGGVNLAFTDSSTVSAADGEILVALNREHHG
jgi:multidrug efflux pump subunit AcrB